jgi:hypothetical protein
LLPARGWVSDVPDFYRKKVAELEMCLNDEVDGVDGNCADRNDS